MNLIAQPARARRLAAVIATDIALYAAVKLKRAVADDAVFERFTGEFAEAKRYYCGRVSAEVDASGHFIDLAFCNLVLRRQGHIRSPMW